MINELDKIKILREKTNAGVMDCKNALCEAMWDIEKAIEVLRKRGISLATKKSSRATKEGIVSSYIHLDGKIGVLVEVNCETDFVARNGEFKTFVKDIAMQVAALNPTYLKKEDIPKDVQDKEVEIIREQNNGKPAQALDKIIEGRLNGFYQEVCLLEQPFIKDPKLFVKDLLTSLIAKTGENIVIKRFTRYQLGETA